MAEDYGHSRIVWQGEISKVGERYLEADLEALYRVIKSNFWRWDDGSIILFWRWPREITKESQDGYEIFIKGKLPRFTKKQQIPIDPTEFEMIKKKVDKVRSRRYIYGVTVLSLTAFLCAKGLG